LLVTYIVDVPVPLYNRDILRLAANIPHLGLLERADGRAECSSAVCGSRVSVAVRLDEEGRVAELGQEVRACALGQASAALMGRHAIGRSPEELAEARDELADFLKGQRDGPGMWPGLDVLAVAQPYSGRHSAILLPFEAVAAAAGSAVARAEAG
jgi:NifU-like protein involved in Fe-S cluster formation